MGSKWNFPFTLAQPKAAIRHLLHLGEGEGYSSNSIEENAYLQVSMRMEKRHVMLHNPPFQNSSWEKPNTSHMHNASRLPVPLQNCSEGHGPTC